MTGSSSARRPRSSKSPTSIRSATPRAMRSGGSEVGSIRQQNVFGKIRFGLLDASGQEVGQIQAENWRAWNFAIVDSTGSEIGRITKTWEGFAKTLFTSADNYLLVIAQ